MTHYRQRQIIGARLRVINKIDIIINYMKIINTMKDMKPIHTQEAAKQPFCKNPRNSGNHLSQYLVSSMLTNVLMTASGNCFQYDNYANDKK